MLAVFFAFLSVFTFVLVLAGSRSKSTAETLGKRLSVIERASQKASGEKDSLALARSGGKHAGFNLENWMRTFGAGRSLELLILQSGVSWKLRNVALLSCGLAVAAGAITALIGVGWPIAIGISMVAGALPYAALRRKRARRLVQFEAALPEAIAVMARCLRAGHALSSALEIVSEQSSGPLAAEFARVSQQQQLGVMFRESVLELASRIPSQDLHFLVTAILVQKESGGDLTEILDGATRVISDRMRIAAQVRTHSAQGRLSGWILSIMPLILFVVTNLLNPGYASLLFKDPTGRLLLYGGLSSMVIGMLAIRKIVNIKV